MSNDEMTTSLIINNDENLDNSSRNGGELINRDENFFNENDLSQSEYENEVPDTFDNLTNAKKRYHLINAVIKLLIYHIRRMSRKIQFVMYVAL
jgi:hypothetical protein